jgi:hypothetical protein
VAITALVILNFIGRGLHPKGAAFRFKKRALMALIPKPALKSSLNQVRQTTCCSEEELLEAEQLSIGVYVSL